MVLQVYRVRPAVAWTPEIILAGNYFGEPIGGWFVLYIDEPLVLELLQGKFHDNASTRLSPFFISSTTWQSPVRVTAVLIALRD